MTNAVSREMVDAFYAAYASHDTVRLAELLHDDVQWTISGPVSVLTYCGTRRGKAEVLDLVDRVIPGLFRVTGFVQDSVVVDGDRVATLNRLTARRCADGRVISYRLAHFIRYCDGKLIENVSLIDSFDAAEQMLGHPLDVHDQNMTELPELTDAGGLVVV